MAGQHEQRKSFETKGTANFGVDYITDANAHTGNWWQVYFPTNATIQSITAEVYDGNGSKTDLSGVSFNAGDFMPIPFCTEFQLSSGTAVLMRSQDY